MNMQHAVATTSKSTVSDQTPGVPGQPSKKPCPPKVCKLKYQVPTSPITATTEYVIDLEFQPCFNPVMLMR